MRALIASLSAELLKTKRTLALALTGVAPAVIALLVSGFYLQRKEYYTPDPGINPWTQYSQMMLVYWNLLLLPLFITLEAALITQLEHGRKNWKLLFTTPLPRWSIYAAKLLIVLAWIGLSDLVLLGFMLACGGILQWIYPPFQLNVPFPWGEVLPLLGLSYVSAWFMISFHTWVGTRWSSFVVAMSAGIAATIVSLFIFGEDIANYFPWSIPGVLSLEAGANVDVAACLIIGLAGGVLAALLGGLDIVRKDVV